MDGRYAVESMSSDAALLYGSTTYDGFRRQIRFASLELLLAIAVLLALL